MVPRGMHPANHVPGDHRAQHAEDGPLTGAGDQCVKARRWEIHVAVTDSALTPRQESHNQVERDVRPAFEKLHPEQNVFSRSKIKLKS